MFLFVNPKITFLYRKLIDKAYFYNYTIDSCMKFINHLTLGYRNYLKAGSFIVTHRLWQYILIPLILFGIIFYTGNHFRELRELNQETLDTGDVGFFSMIWITIKSSFLWVLQFLLLDFTKYIVMIILSPLLAYLSEKVEEILTGNEYKFNLKQLLKDVRRGIGIAIRMLFAEFVIIYFIWHPISFVLGLNENFFGVNDDNYLVRTVDIFIGFYFYGFGYIDYINERLRLSVKQSWQFMKKHAGLAVAIGSVFSLLFYIPSLIDANNKWIDTALDNIGVVIAPVWAIVAATLAMHELIDLNNSQYAVKKDAQQ